VFVGQPERLDTVALTEIYGEEDWSAMRQAAAEDADAEREQAERMAGLA
jgi:phosphonate transport system ATP-binding protein